LLPEERKVAFLGKHRNILTSIQDTDSL
jgi:hypothetical protein